MTNKQKIIAEIERLMNNRSKTLVDGSYWDYKGLIDFINSLPEESVSEDLKEAANFYADTHTEWFDADNNPHVSPAFKAGAEWNFERIKEALLSKVLPYFMNGGEADEVVAKLDEVLNQK